MPARSVAVIRRVCSIALPAVLVVGCASQDVTPAARPAGPAQSSTPQAKNTGNFPPVSAANASAKPAAPTAAAIPVGAKYTIMCMAFPGAGNAAIATAWKDDVIRATGRKDFYVVHEENQSTIYHGYYKEYQRDARDVDPKETARADADLAYVKSLVNAEGRPLFARSLFVPLPAADPVAPPEFDLARLDADRAKDDPERKYWSIAIAAYTADATPTGVDAGKTRKQLAVESVMDARKQGIEAYFYHGPNMSMVCIGAWPRRALKQQMSDTELKRYDNGDPIIASSTRLPQHVLDDIESTGKHVNIVQPKNEIDDPTLLSTWKQYPDYLVNGQLDVDVVTDPATGQKKRQAKSSFVFEIPLAQQGSAPALGRSAQAAQPEQAPETNPLLPGQGMGGGRLRSVRP